MKRLYGFTLMELIIAVAIIGILASIAYPSYLQQVAKAKRAEAASALLQGAQALERYYSTNGRYVDADGNIASVFPTQVPENGDAYYTIAAVNVSANTFTLRATRAGSMTGDACGNFELDAAGVQALDGDKAGYSVADCWRR